MRPLHNPVASCLIVVAMALAPAAASAVVKLPPFFSDHMVLQRDGKAPVWGTADPGEQVTVRFRDQAPETKADAQGRWRVELTNLKAGGPDELSVVGSNTVKFGDVLVGEVWVGSGQSNMAGNVRGYSKNDPVLADLAAKTHSRIRGCSATKGWTVATPENNAAYSALLFSFAVRLNEQLDVPVGMMLGAVGGTPSGAWTPAEAVAEDAACQALIAEYAQGYDELLKDYETRIMPAWRKGAEQAKAAGRAVGRAPLEPPKPGTARNRTPGYLYDQHIKPLVGYGIRGVLWDQGEARTQVGGVDQFTMMGALIRGWRKAWGLGEFPFIYVQKPSGGGCAFDPINPVNTASEKFEPLPKAQPGQVDRDVRADFAGRDVENHIRIMSYPNVGMAISSDLGPMTHPVNKSGYGTRAAAVALGMAYGRPVEYYGPLYDSHKIEGNKIRIAFTHVGKGLVQKHGDKLQGFIIAGADKNFVWAEAAIDGDTIVVSSPEVPQPTAVRYAWAYKRPWANLFNQDGLPAVPFRTDRDAE